MIGYLIFSLKKTIEISSNNELKKKYKNSYFLTDRVIIFLYSKNMVSRLFCSRIFKSKKI